MLKEVLPLYKDPLLKGSGCSLTCLEARMKARADKVAASRAAIAASGIAHLTAQAPGLYLLEEYCLNYCFSHVHSYRDHIFNA